MRDCERCFWVEGCGRGLFIESESSGQPEADQSNLEANSAQGE